jgi:hypothetical protein
MLSPHSPTSTEALPLARTDVIRGPKGAWCVRSDGERGFYARCWFLGKTIVLSTDHVIEGATLDDVRANIRAALPLQDRFGLINVGRLDDDDPQVVEWWV